MLIGDCRDRDRMVVGFTTTYAISAYHHWCCEGLCIPGGIILTEVNASALAWFIKYSYLYNLQSIYASCDSIYKETGWETLSFNALHLFRILECSTLRKRSPIEWYWGFLLLVYNICYLYELVPPLVAANVIYNLRNSYNIHEPFNRLSVY
jgi:hypothetical protein